MPLPMDAFPDYVDTPDDGGWAAVIASASAARRWNMPVPGVPGVPPGERPERPNLNQRRANGIADLLKAQGSARSRGPGFDLVTKPTGAAAER